MVAGVVETERRRMLRMPMASEVTAPPRFTLGPWSEWKPLIGGMGLGWMLALGGWLALLAVGYFVLAFLFAVYDWRWRKKEWEYEMRQLAERGPGETTKMNCAQCRRAELAVRRPDGTVFVWDATRQPQVAGTPNLCWQCI